jgi:hypothetical protein
MILVTVNNKDTKFYLRGTTWVFAIERANRFSSIEDAKVAIEKARKFMPPSVFKKISFEEAT